MSTVFSSVTQALESCFGCSHSTDCEILHGGCIGVVKKVTLSNGTLLVIKQNTNVAPDRACALCLAEATGLEQIEATRTIRVPHVYAVFTSEGRVGATTCNGISAMDHTHPGVILEYIPTENVSGHFWDTFGIQLAQLHNHAAGDSFGFVQDNFIGSTPQINTNEQSWITFFSTHRLWYQCALASKQGYLNADALQRAERLCASLSSYIDEPTYPSLLHGDLWGGNYLCALDGTPVIIDPAAYYGHAEADLAMTELFGGYPTTFYRAYNTVRTIDKEYHTRKHIYNLYHLLNHLNLFGASYLGQVLHILRRFI